MQQARQRFPQLTEKQRYFPFGDQHAILPAAAAMNRKMPKGHD
jgi:hypothetical protein